jgi:type II secretory pathway pseudopilin PulG
MKKAQIWIETVIYTVIGLAIIGIILAVATPAIDRYKDEIIIEQTITVLNNLNNEILDVKYYGVGNRIPFEFRIKKGEITVDGKEDKVIYVLKESRLEYSESGQAIDQGGITIRTDKKGGKFEISLTLTYNDANLTYNSKDEVKKFYSSSTPYKIFIENLGGESSQIDFQQG